jgi:hypothetical protein
MTDLKPDGIVGNSPANHHNSRRADKDMVVVDCAASGPWAEKPRSKATSD